MLKSQLHPIMEPAAVVERLHKHGQRATYAAVGGLVGRLPRSVMHSQQRSHQNSWVVAKETGVPTGYSLAECDPRLRVSSEPIHTAESLQLWLKANP